jgi:hypothetical protein
MKDEERAGRLARAVDDLIREQNSPGKQHGLGDDELDALLQIAQSRLEAARAAARAGLQHEGAVWKDLLQRMRAGSAHTGESRESPLDELLPGLGPADPDLAAIEEIARLRRRLAEQTKSFAETHREAVWRQVQSRIQARRRRKGVFSLFRRDRREADELAPTLDGLVAGQTIWGAAGSRIDELVELARKRRVLGLAAQSTASRSQGRVWMRLQRRLTGAGEPPARTPQAPAGRPFRPRFALAAAVLALIAAALGPVPATGLADHPAVHLTQLAGRHLGVIESSPPTALPDAVTVHGIPVDAAEAARLLGVPVAEPADLPNGLSLKASLYFPEGVRSGGGVFVLSYESPEARLIILQEAASGADLAVEPGSVQDMTLADGTPATYINGAWSEHQAGLQWDTENSRTLLFERDGVRTTIVFSGEGGSPGLLATIAEAISS